MLASRSDRVCKHGNESGKCSRCIAEILVSIDAPHIVHCFPDGRWEVIKLPHEPPKEA